MISSFITGFAPSRAEADWITSATKMITEIVKMTSGKGSGERLFKYTLKTVSDGAGLGLYPLYRELMSIYNLFDDLLN
jgi:hypothetical protein